MSDAIPNRPPEVATYRATFGYYAQNTPWNDVRNLTWVELADVLTTHSPGPKQGDCIVPAVFRNGQRKKSDADRIDVVFLDSDAGATLVEIEQAIRRRGWAAVIASTHSHMTQTTCIKRGNWDKFRAAAADQHGAPETYLLQDKGYLVSVAAGASVVAETDQEVTFAHQPCPKFRIAMPLLRPWFAANYNGQAEANAAWKACIEALAAALHLNHDQSCTDTSRLFYLPRRPVDGPEPETLVLNGTACDIFALPPPPKPQRLRKARAAATQGRAKGTARTGLGFGLGDAPLQFSDSKTGEVLELRRWAATYARRFKPVTALQARQPEVFIGKVVDGKHHLRCVNAAAHTTGADDTATFVMNAEEAESGTFIHHCRHAHCDGRDRLLFVQQMLEQGWLTIADLTEPLFLHGNTRPPRPLIRSIAGDLENIVDHAEEALLGAGLNLYQRGPFIVRPGRVRVTLDKQQEVSGLRILEVQDHAMVEAMTSAADWLRYDARAEDWVTIDAPTKVANTYRQRTGRWRLPVLAGLINAPTLRADGSILSASGYDASTGLLLQTDSVRFPQIPDRPSRADALHALADLNALIETFPFVDAPSRSVALSAILTACIRRSLPTAPMHAFTAPTAGSGKSMLVDVASLIATGREAGVIAQGKTEEELEKRLGALLLAGDQVIAIDNCESPLGGEFLCSMLTQRIVRARILGRSEAPELPSNACVTATGNNLVLVGDMTRRAVMCRLDPKHERPELRQFANSPIAEVKADRGRYLVAVLIVLRAYHVAGRPQQADPLGSFEDWSGWVRGALLWLGQADAVHTQETIRANDPRLDALTAVLSQWSLHLGHRRATARNIIDCATEHRTGFGSLNMKTDFVRPDFREALLVIAGDGGSINSRRLGRWIAAHEERVVQGQRICRQGMLTGTMTWALLAEDVADRDAA
ncbi:hypothetical protein ACQW02_12655 [Humitalea sp. 24SJ18S-53]|uniref:hypothetical protein n=1 Tax=Humitalea sp. 24SJ18S-53 TaxID=3422307 RepID=UPI003D67968F